MNREEHNLALRLVRESGSEAPPALGEGCELQLSFNIGASVRCEDGRCGRLARVVIDPVNNQVTALIVAKGFLQKQDRVVPVSAVTAAGDGEIVLGIHSSALPGFREFREVDYRVPVEGWSNDQAQPKYTWHTMVPVAGIIAVGGQAAESRRYHRREGVSFDLKVIAKGTKVQDADGTVGEVDHVLVDCVDQQITDIVVRHGLLGEYLIVPVDAIVSVDDAGIVLALARDALRALQRYERS